MEFNYSKKENEHSFSFKISPEWLTAIGTIILLFL